MRLSKSLLLLPAASFLFAASVGAGACSSSASVGAPSGDVFEDSVTLGAACSSTLYVTGSTGGFAYCSGGVWVYTDDQSDIPSTDTAYTPKGDDAGNDDAGNDDAGNDDAGNDDAGNDDAGNDDAGNIDAGNDDAGNDDAGSEDAGGDDAASPDGGASGDDSGTSADSGS